MIQAWPDEKWVPDSCCLPAAQFSELAGKHCGQTKNPDFWFSRGCSEQIHMWFVQRLHIVGVVGLVVAFVQVIIKIRFKLINLFNESERVCLF